MALTFDQKQAVVAEVAEVAAKAYSAVAAEYRGMTVEQLTALRVKARKEGGLPARGEEHARPHRGAWYRI